MGVHTFPKGICPKVNVIARLEYELANYDSAVHRFNHYTTRTSPCLELRFFLSSRSVSVPKLKSAWLFTLNCWGGIVEFIPFPNLFEMPRASFRSWTGVDGSHTRRVYCGSVKLMDKFTYFRSSVFSTENDMICDKQRYGLISIGYRSCGS